MSGRRGRSLLLAAALCCAAVVGAGGGVADAAGSARGSPLRSVAAILNLYAGA